MADVDLPRFNKVCNQCGFLIKFSHKYCTQCGCEAIDDTEDDEDEREIITYYFRRGFEYEGIVQLLNKKHNIQMSTRTLKNRLKEYNLKRRGVAYDEEQIRQRIAELIDGPGCMGGYRSVWHTLCLEGAQVPRDVVQRLLKELDPEGCALRKAKRLKRRKYRSLGPNHCWHIDGYDKLSPYGFPIHAAIDGWSRRIMSLKVCRSNNFPEIPASFYLQCVAENKGCPEKLRTDNGTENGIMATMQCMFRDDATAHVYGRSTANQRIECWWSQFRRNRSTWWMNFFKDLVETEIYCPGNELQTECLWFCYSGVIQEDLNFVQQHWNTHSIRRSSHDTISGKPDELFSLPENKGGEDKLHPVSEGMIEFVAENLLQFDEATNLYQEYFEYLVANTNLQMPTNWREASALYDELIRLYEQNN